MASCQKLLYYFTIPIVYTRRLFRNSGGKWKLKLFTAVAQIDRQQDQIANAAGLRASNLVEVRTKEEILQTLDQDGRLDGMPFMPEMFSSCGKRFTVYKRAHKGCDTVFPIRSRRFRNTVHLETRCDGQAHGGCQASCLLYWKEAWLRRVEESTECGALKSRLVASVNERSVIVSRCTEEDVYSATRSEEDKSNSDPAHIFARRLNYHTLRKL